MPQWERRFPEALTLTREERLWMASRENPQSPFHCIIGNAPVLEQCELIVAQALGRVNHRASDLHLAWIGPAGVGKTMLAKAMADALQLPFVDLNPQQLKKPDDIFQEMQRVFRETGVLDPARRAVTLEMTPDENGCFFAPSCICFIDEVHQLPPTGKVVQSLLTATEKSTHLLKGQDFVMDTRAVTWMFATTDRGLLFDAFDTRFLKLELKPYTQSEVAQIIQVHNPAMPFLACELVSRYCWRVTREAFDFTRLVLIERNARGVGWTEAVEAVRVRQGIDQWGMDAKRLGVLRALGQGPLSLEGLEAHARCKAEELKKFVLPAMRTFGDGFHPLIQVTHRYFITQAGIEELDRRGIPHQGPAALPRVA